MSGGSFNYLYAKEGQELVDTWNHLDRSDLSDMIDHLRQLDGDDVADELLDMQLTLRAAVRRADVVMRRCAPVMKAVEWWRSCDSGRDDAVEAIEEWRRPDGDDD